MYRDDRAMSDGMEHLSEETSDKVEHPLKEEHLEIFELWCNRP